MVTSLPLASVVIVTHQRYTWLAMNVEALWPQLEAAGWELLVVDDGSDPAVAQLVGQYPGARYLPGKEQGSAAARNAGIREASHSWVVFLDDDLRVPAGFVDRAARWIQAGCFDGFGGMYYPWYPHHNKPAWLPADFGQKRPLTTEAGPIEVGRHGFLSAGVMACKKAALLDVGGFAADLGIHGNFLGYGEEDDLQLRLQAKGYVLGFDPAWYVAHAVLPHKYRLSWHWWAAYARARDEQRIHGRYSRAQVLGYLVAVTLLAPVKRLPWVCYQWMCSPNYYWQNAWLEWTRPWAVWWGRWQATTKKYRR